MSRQRRRGDAAGVKKLTLEEAEEIAKKLTHDALLSYVLPEEIGDRLALEILIEGDVRVFALVVPGERPKDGKIVSQARIDLRDGSGTVEIFGLQRRDSSTEPIGAGEPTSRVDVSETGVDSDADRP